MAKPPGTYVTTTFADEQVRAYVPTPLPPDPLPDLTPFHGLMEHSLLSLGRLDGLAEVLPNIAVLLYTYVRKEALLSSQIEGTQSSLSDLILYENSEVPGVPVHDVQDVSSYVAALYYGLNRLREGFPLSLRLIRDIHRVLLAAGRGSEKTPGEFRTSQNWIGGTRPGNAFFVPPPADRVVDCMGQLELFLHDQRADVPLLLKAALAHVQFETIYPFLDGNGRLGRLLITFLLCANGALREPLLYLSLYFKRNRQQYYDLLTHVRNTGDWESWIHFFLVGVKETADEAVASARRILAQLDEDRKKIEALGRPSASVLRVFQHSQTQPILSIAGITGKVGLTFPTVSAAIEHLRDLGIMHEVTGKQRSRLFVYKAYYDILSEGTEPIR